MKHHAEIALLVFSVLAAGCPIFQARNILEIVCSLFGTHVSTMYWFTPICQIQRHFSRCLFKNSAERRQFPENVFRFDSQGPEIRPPWLPPANFVLQITAVVSQLWSLHREFTPLKKGAEVQTSAQQHALTDVRCLCSWYSAPEYTDEIRARPGWDSLWPEM